MIRRWRRLLFAVAALLALSAAGAGAVYWHDRTLLGFAPPEPVVRIGLVWSDLEGNRFLQGAELARQEINEAGGLLGRRLEFRLEDVTGNETPRSAANVARRMARTDDLVAVVGHRDAESAVTASITYEERGVVYVNVAVPNDEVNKYAFRHVFSTIPDNETIGRQLATYVEGLGIRRIGILSSRDDWVFQTAESFLQQAVTLGLDIRARRSFFGNREVFLDLIAEFASSDFDAILVIAPNETIGRIVRQIVDMKLEVDVILGILADPVELAGEIGSLPRPVTMPVLYNPNSTHPDVMDFRARFEALYGEPPDAWAAQGYDAVRMIADTIAATGTLEPLSIATIFRYSLTWRGVTGRHSFDPSGRIYTKPVGFASIQDGEVTYSGDVN